MTNSHLHSKIRLPKHIFRSYALLKMTTSRLVEYSIFFRDFRVIAWFKSSTKAWRAENGARFRL